jgi:hypothetical protein
MAHVVVHFKYGIVLRQSRQNTNIRAPQTCRSDIIRMIDSRPSNLLFVNDLDFRISRENLSTV